MELRIFTEPQQGADYGRLLAVARATEQLGFDAFFRSDHYLSMGDGDGLPGPTDAWLTLAGLALQTSRIRLGTLMSPITFRYPGPLAISAAQVDEMSGGRVELGTRGGLVRGRAHGLRHPVPLRRPSDSTGWKNSSRSSPACGRPRSASGFRLRGSFIPSPTHPALPKPVQRPHPPILIGGRGPRRTPQLTARYADEYNVAFVDRSSRPRPRSAGSARRARRLGGTRAPWSTRPRRRSAAAGTRPSWRAARRRSAGIWPPSAPTGWSGPRTRSWTGSGRSPGSVRRGSTSRCWTCTTWTIWS